ISEADNEEVILNFLEDFKKSIGISVPRSMVPPTPNVDLYKLRKRKRNAKSSEEEPKKKEIKKEKMESSGKEKEKEIVAEEEIVAAAEEGKKKDNKRKSSGVKIVEGRTKMKHDKKSKKDDSSTESDEEILAQRLKQKTSEAYAKEMHKKISKGKFSESSKFVSSEAQIPGYDIPLTTVLPETKPINVTSSSSPDTADLDKEADTLMEG
ncbi:hypothetical protein A2U01_0041558, partial [Trifolium medium]|nr:hypothetical protein [Trifolium medium]